MEKIVFLDRDSVRADFRKPRFAHEWQEFASTEPEEVLERLRGATIAITNKVALRAATLEQLPELRMIAVAATGTDCIDTEYCREKGIVVSNVTDYSTHSVPEHVFALTLSLIRNLNAYQDDIRRGLWQKSPIFCLLDHPVRELYGATLGIIGYGNLGRGVEKIARAFGMKVLIAEHREAAEIRDGRTPFEEVLEKSDVLTLHCPLTAETRNLIGEREFAAMKKSAILINCGRGGLVDEKSLVDALQTGAIAGAGFDVLTTEPPRAGNILLDLQLPNLIVTPHIAWSSREGMQMLADILIDKLEAWILSTTAPTFSSKINTGGA
ncbi:MAG TPA: D-2-hydroxyacid dehydrogenase [Pyrinomonadaceae bacterium]|jgi:glycerate dehydrogenase|nr:D-2-hydroxyacid dehydrogenase [Pyrinomonadaceae bacterium]